MTHPDEAQLIFFYYRDVRRQEAVARHLDTCPACRDAYRELETWLNALEPDPPPDPEPDFEARVWARVRPRLPARPPWHWTALLRPPRWVAVAAAAVLIIAAFLAGRWSPRQPSPAIQPVAEQARDRILLVALGDHFERSQLVLVELVNSAPQPAMDISSEQLRAEDLIAANRLYRQTAARAGEPGLAALLEELERVLLDIAHRPHRLSATEFEAIRGRIEAQAILFKVRVVGASLRQTPTRKGS